MAKYLTNSILKFKQLTVNGFTVHDYSSIDFSGVQKLVNNSPVIWFGWYRLENNDNIERVSLEIYSNADYWDMLLVINNKNPLYDTPVDFDTVLGNVDYVVNEYETQVYKKTLPVAVKELLVKNLSDDFTKKVERDRVIRIVKPAYLREFIKSGIDAGVFNA